MHLHLHSSLLLLLVFSLLNSSFSLSSDEQRPNFHVMPPSNWQNDPCGPFFLKPFYHLFYQYNPNAAVWGDMHWGHVVSTDLAHWMHLDPALEPSESYDSAGIFTGSVTMIDGKPIIIYTGQTGVEQQCLAYPKNLSDPYLLEWVKEPSNPVISTPPPGVDAGDWRDPTTAWWVESQQRWHILVGGMYNGKIGAAFSFSSSSSDFLKWSYDNPLYQSTSYGNFECPDFFEASLTSETVSPIHILKFSGENPHGDYFFAGTYDEASNTISPISSIQVVDYSPQFYASKRFLDPNSGEDIMWGWISEADSNAEQRGWAGVQSVPRFIQYDPTLNWIISNPAQELSLLHEAEVSEKNVILSANSVVSLTDRSNQTVKGQQYHLKVNFGSSNVFNSSQTLGIRVRESSDSSQYTSLSLQFSLSPYKFSKMKIEGEVLESLVLPSTNDLTHEELFGKCEILCEDSRDCVGWVLQITSEGSLCLLHKNLHRIYRTTSDDESQSTSTQFVSMKKQANYQMAYLTVDRSHSGTDGDSGPQGGFFPVSPNEDLVSFEVFVDHSLIEVFVQGGRATVSSRVYPQSTDSLDISVYSGSSEFVVDYSFWNMKSCWVEGFDI